MRVLVTGARGRVGAATVCELVEAGHDVTGSDLAPPVYESGVRYFQADLTDAGEAYAVVRGHDAVIHCAAVPDPTRHAPHVLFRNNLMAVFNVVEACVRLGADRLVNVSSETVLGTAFAERPFLTEYAPIDEALPSRPQDPYALAKVFGEQLMDAAAARSDLRCVTIRPPWVVWEGSYERNLGPWLRDPFGAPASESFWSYVDVYDLAHALRLAAECELDGHQTMYAAAADNGAGRGLRELIEYHYGEAVTIRELPRPDASGISSARAAALLGWTPTRAWRDYLTADGALLDDARERLRTGATGVQRGRAYLS